MENELPNRNETPTRRGGGRVASTQYRSSLQQATDFSGLEGDTNRYDLLLLVKRAGKAAGFTPRMIQLLDYYLAFTRDLDWEEGSRPIVFQSLARTALDLGVSERQIQLLEQRLFEAGAITWNDSGNHRRYGHRCAHTGRLRFAYGVDLTPLAYLRPRLEEKLHEKQLYDQAWLETKRQISFYRRQIRASLLELDREEGAQAGLLTLERQYDAIACPIRTHLPLAKLRTLLEEHKSLHDRTLAELPTGGGDSRPTDERSDNEQKTEKDSPLGEKNFVHYKSTTQQPFDESNTSSPADTGFQESVTNSAEHQIRSVPDETTAIRAKVTDRESRILATGMQHITLKHALEAASPRLRDYLPAASHAVNWTDLVEAAYRHRPNLHISQQTWRDACTMLGRNGAAVCLLLTDRAALRPENPVTKPAAYFRSLISRAERGELRLHRSLFGLLQ